VEEMFFEIGLFISK